MNSGINMVWEKDRNANVMAEPLGSKWEVYTTHGAWRSVLRYFAAVITNAVMTVPRNDAAHRGKWLLSVQLTCQKQLRTHNLGK